ncbi:uncharacterized protein LAJ45_08118 [Morchella importuna]|uniref:uncharacterized protein n=1 Tax=Morchella importuna TaxID=1174673 RepID=UPI001E8EBC07|nr:uncharacterized protein LAJ45_08118 [Morchella importuna]KAH8147654.1 hypothetical protein LAJ45_08118 [Morchella importuna]
MAIGTAQCVTVECVVGVHVYSLFYYTATSQLGQIVEEGQRPAILSQFSTHLLDAKPSALPLDHIPLHHAISLASTTLRVYPYYLDESHIHHIEYYTTIEGGGGEEMRLPGGAAGGRIYSDETGV